jgi:hypothetical protein
MEPEFIEPLEQFIRFYFFASGILGAFAGVIIWKVFEAIGNCFNPTD